MPYNGPRVWAESGGGDVPPATCPGALAVKLSRRASHHGAVFANPGVSFEKLVSLTTILVLVDDREANCKYRDKLFAYTRVLAAVFLNARNLSWFTIIRFAEATGYNY
jgi:hypothetical protein